MTKTSDAKKKSAIDLSPHSEREGSGEEKESMWDMRPEGVSEPGRASAGNSPVTQGLGQADIP